MIDNNDKVNSIVGSYFEGGDFNLPDFMPSFNVALSLYEANLPGKCAQVLLGRDYYSIHDKVTTIANEFCLLSVQEEKLRSKVITLGDIDCQNMFGRADIENIDTSAVLARLDRLIASGTGALSQWMDYCRTRDDAVRAGPGKILDIYDKDKCRFDNLCSVSDFVFYRSLIRQAFNKYPELSRFSGTSYEAARKRFQELDIELIKLQRSALAAFLSSQKIYLGIGSGPKSKWTDGSLILNEIGKKTRHIPLRDLLKRAGVAIQQMKPCFMMSPASVAQFIIPGGNIEFDLIIIDEASQMKPEEAIGAIARGKQLVVVGDPQQLPPTSFFDRIESPEEDTEADEDYIDTESILDLALTTFRPNRELRWHYRSRHDSLIAFSNYNFYDNSLIVFPSAASELKDLGVAYSKVEGSYRGRVNIPEVQAVVKAAIDFIHKYPYRSLGIVTINQTQKDIILEEMERVFASDKRVQAYLQRWESTIEPFFIKNLENVQGDERDVIIISTVYGPNETGKVLQRFGPINTAGGHRRLNVLFTRAKEKVILFSSMTPPDIIPTESSNKGVGILKDYIEYSISGKLPTAKCDGREPDSDFEIFVAERLRQHGFEVIPQVGVTGFSIDLAVKDPNGSGEYILGIECDGSTYHSSKSARDRDRLRQEVLENLGWKIYRIWSLDWFNDPDGQMAKLVAYIRHLSDERNKIMASNLEPELDSIDIEIEDVDLINELEQQHTAKEIQPVVRQIKLESRMRPYAKLADSPLYSLPASYCIAIVEWMEQKKLSITKTRPILNLIRTIMARQGHPGFKHSMITGNEEKEAIDAINWAILQGFSDKGLSEMLTQLRQGTIKNEFIKSYARLYGYQLEPI